MTKRFRASKQPATQQPPAKQPNSPPVRSEDTARPSKASEFKLRFRPFFDKKLSEVPRLYLWELAGYDKHSANGNLLRASEMATEYLKELGLIQTKKKKPRKVKYCSCCYRNPCKITKKICGKCERYKKAAEELKKITEEKIENVRLACEFIVESIMEIESPEWHSSQWRVS